MQIAGTDFIEHNNTSSSTQPHIIQVYKIDPPPDGVFPSEAAAEDVIHKMTLSRRFNVSRQKVERNKNGDIRTKLFACDRSGKPKNNCHLREEDHVRTMRGSKRMGCPIRIKIVAVDENNTEGPWKIVHTRDGSTKHNHPTSLDVRVHVGHRQRSSQQGTAPEVSTVNDFIFYQTAAGVPVSKVYATLLLTDTSSLLIPKDVANVKDAKRRNLLAADTAIEALFRKLTEHGFHFKYEVNEDSGRLKYPDTLKLAQPYMGVVVVDCTYKTNKHNWHLCNIIALTGLNKVFPLAQCWLPGEAKPNYTWAFTQLKSLLRDNSIPLPRLFATDRDLACMNASDTVFSDVPKILCRWHVNRNILARVQGDLGTVRLSHPGPNGEMKQNSVETDVFMAKYYEAIASETTTEFEQHCTAVRNLSSVTAD